MAAGMTAIELLWGQRAAPKRGPQPTLSVARIAAVGVGIADAEGLAAVTMHRVAEQLGVTKMALYRYVPGKVELVALMIDLGLGEPPRLERVPGGWRPKLDLWARRMFDQFRAHPWALEVTVGGRAVGPNELGWLEQATAALTGIGLAGSEILDVAMTLVGHVRMVVQQVAAMGTDTPEQAAHEAMDAVLAGREDQFPALVAALANPAGKDQALDFGLRCILDGVQLLIDQSRPVGRVPSQ
ncbi:TetR/AcrR family transcriptional regulator [Micromonospora sp. NBC_00858]|uniref:TetR/AcrR family transcriptional regulator n=1 Tax=Micromonospora sp. NBC_00858 TaxID=2975979 RepID=UPI003864A896|nr:TetR/AcrR family transcriptional regulator [Micromonospora sp. NBC_00858]